MQSGNQFNRTFYYEYGTCKMVKTGLQKDNHVCDMFFQTDEKLANFKKEQSYKKMKRTILVCSVIYDK